MVDFETINLETENEFETYKLNDPEVLVFLSINEKTINKDFLEFFTI